VRPDTQHEGAQVRGWWPRELAEALGAQGSSFSLESILGWFRQHASWVDPLWVEGTLEASTVNDPARRHYPSPRDLVFRNRDGSLERYLPRRHGRWSAEGTPVTCIAFPVRPGPTPVIHRRKHFMPLDTRASHRRRSHAGQLRPLERGAPCAQSESSFPSRAQSRSS